MSDDEEESADIMESDGSFEHVEKDFVPDNEALDTVTCKSILKRKGEEMETAPKNVSFRFVIADYVEPVPINIIDEEEYANVLESYEELCTKLRVRPCRKLLDQLEGLQDSTLKLDTIDLKGTRLDSAHCEALEAVLRVLRAQTLNIEQTQLDDDGAISLFEMIEYYEPVTRLIVANNIRLGVRAWLALARLLKRFHRLEYLDVRRTSLDESTMPLLCRVLKLNCTLRVLHLEDNHLSGILTRNLVWGLRTNTMLQDLFLGHNKLTPEDAKLLGSLLITNHTIRLLDLRNNRLQDTGIIFLASALEEQHAGLQLITVWSNQITANSMSALSRALAFHTTLEGVNLGSNTLGNKGVENLKEGLLSSRSIARLVMASCNITNEGAVVMAEIIGDHTTLIHLDLRENNISLAGVLALKCAYAINHKLLRLHLDVMKRNNHDPLMEQLLTEIEQYSVRNLEHHKHSDQVIAAKLQKSEGATNVIRDNREETATTRSLQEQVDYQLAMKLQQEENNHQHRKEEIKRPLPILSPALSSPPDPTKTFGFFSGHYMKLKARWDENVAVYLNRPDISLAASPGTDGPRVYEKQDTSTDDDEDLFEDAVETVENHDRTNKPDDLPNHLHDHMTYHVTKPSDHVTYHVTSEEVLDSSEDPVAATAINADFDEVWFTGPENEFIPQENNIYHDDNITGYHDDDTGYPDNSTGYHDNTGYPDNTVTCRDNSSTDSSSDCNTSTTDDTSNDDSVYSRSSSLSPYYGSDSATNESTTPTTDTSDSYITGHLTRTSDSTPTSDSTRTNDSMRTSDSTRSSDSTRTSDLTQTSDSTPTSDISHDTNFTRSSSDTYSDQGFLPHDYEGTRQLRGSDTPTHTPARAAT